MRKLSSKLTVTVATRGNHNLGTTSLPRIPLFCQGWVWVWGGAAVSNPKCHVQTQSHRAQGFSIKMLLGLSASCSEVVFRSQSSVPMLPFQFLPWKREIGEVTTEFQSGRPAALNEPLRVALVIQTLATFPG